MTVYEYIDIDMQALSIYNMHTRNMCINHSIQAGALSIPIRQGRSYSLDSLDSPYSVGSVSGESDLSSSDDEDDDEDDDDGEDMCLHV